MSWSTYHSVGIDSLVVAALAAGCSCVPGPAGDSGPTADAPAPRWVQVDAVGRTACALRDDGLATCWGYGWSGGRVLPERLASVQASGATRACGLDSEGNIRSFYGEFGPGPFPDGWVVPPGQYHGLAVKLDAACAIDATGAAACWTNDQPSPTNPIFPPPTSEPFVQLAVYGWACGVSNSGTGVCWMPFLDVPRVMPPPPRRYQFIEPEGTGACGLGSDGEVVCWSDSADWLTVMTPPPTGPFVELTVESPTCALRPTGEAVCWGQRWNDAAPRGLAPRQPVGERYVHITTGSGFFCGILLDGRLSCWGDDDHGQAEPPEP